MDIALGALAFEAEMIERAVEVDFEPGVALRICAAEDLLVLKAFADRPRDQADVLSIARRSGRAVAWGAVEERLAPLAHAKGDRAILDRVREIRRDFGG